MKKILRIFLAAIVMTIAIIPANAAGTGIMAADVVVQDGEMVYIPVSLQSEINATAMSLEYTYDSGLLEVVPEKCCWIPKGALADFSKTAPQAVWAASGAKKLSGDLCVLAFRVLDMKKFEKTEVSCSVTAKNDSGTVGVYADSAGITKTCAHQFGDWMDGGTSGHTRKCSACGKEELQSHDWNSGTAAADPDNQYMTVITYRCSVCSAEKTVEIPGGTQTSNPGSSQGTKPSEPVERFPEETRPQPTYPSEESAENEHRHPDSPKPSSQESSRPDGNPDHAGQEQSGIRQTDSAQPQDYNQSPDSNIRNPQNDAEGNSAAMGKFSAGNAEGNPWESDPTTEKHPMAIKVETTEEAQDENPAAQMEEKDQNAGILPVAAGTGLVVLMAAVLWLMVIKKRKP